MNSRKLIQYLILNVFISATVTGGILFWYDRNYRASLPAVQSAPESAVVEGNSTPVSAEHPPAKITSVIGAGALNSEIVVVKYEGKEELDLAGWQLKDEDGNVYKFPRLTLYPDGVAQIHSTIGTDTVIDLYWGMASPVWSSGENARLFDAQDTLRAVYRVP